MKKFLMFMAAIMTLACCLILVACGDDEKELSPGRDAEKNTTDVAVTGDISEVGAFYAQLNGVVNLQHINDSYLNAKFGVEVSLAQDFTNKERTEASGLTGRSFSVCVRLSSPGTQYYYRTYVSPSNLSYDYYGETYSFTTNKLKTEEKLSYVDLGLPSGTLWATMNVGASRPEGYGDCFAWGETLPKSDYSWSTYKWCNGAYSNLIKYCTSKSYGSVDNITEIDSKDDAAYVNLGKEWRTPTAIQWSELKKQCEWIWSCLNGVNGYYVISKKNDFWLFIPAARGSNISPLAADSGNYWSRSLYTVHSYNAFCLSFSANGGWDIITDYRFVGQSVRPVRATE